MRVYALTDDQLSRIITAATPLPYEYRGQFLCDCVQALALVGDGNVDVLLDRLQRSFMALALLERPCPSGDCQGDSEAGTGERAAVDAV